MSEKATRIIGWVFLDLVCIGIMFFILFYGLNSDTLNLSIYLGMGFSFIPPLVITFVLGRCSVLPSNDPLERLQDAFDYKNKIEKETNGKEKGKKQK